MGRIKMKLSKHHYLEFDHAEIWVELGRVGEGGGGTDVLGTLGPALRLLPLRSPAQAGRCASNYAFHITSSRGVLMWIRIAICDAIWANCESKVKLIRNFANQK